MRIPSLWPRPHWSPRYVRSRLSVELFERRYPDAPWWTSAAVEFIGQWARSGDTCIEWGSGRSSIWLAERGVAVCTVEHDSEWAAEVRRSLHPFADTQVAFAPDSDRESYVNAHPDLDAVDIAVVDGIHRDSCAHRALRLLRPGGVLLIDNIERYVPSRSRSPERLGEIEPEPLWLEFMEQTSDWRCYWTSSGVTDTAIWFKPTLL